MHVLYTPSCSKIQARYITLHLSCQSHWTHADFGSTEVVQCISNTMPRSFGIHRKVVTLVRDEIILKSKERMKNYAAALKTNIPTEGKLSRQSEPIPGWLFTAKCQLATTVACSSLTSAPITVWANILCNMDGATKENSSGRDWKEGTCVPVTTSSGHKVYWDSAACQSNSTFALFRLYSGAAKKTRSEVKHLQFVLQEI